MEGLRHTKTISAMASTSAVNALSDQLVRSLLPSDKSQSKVRKHHDQFNRTLKHHNFARTNQFAVQEKLAGLEEKFQVLNREDLSDALFRRRNELNEHQHRWIPDVLDMLLSLSHLPVRYSKLETLDAPKELNIVPASLKWADIEANDPVDRRSRLWRQPNYSGSSDDEEPLPSSTDTSPMKEKEVVVASDPIASSTLASIQTDLDRALAHGFEKSLFWVNQQPAELSESQVVREVLHMVQGYPTALFGRFDKPMRLQSKFQIRHMAQESSKSVLQSAIMVAWAAQALRRWQNPYPKIPFMQVLEDHIIDISGAFDSTVSQMQTEHLQKLTSGGMVSLLQTVEDLHLASRNLQAARAYLLECKSRDAISFLDLLFDKVCEMEQLGNTKTCEMFKEIFASTFKSYCKPLFAWIQDGTLPPSTSSFFVERAADQTDKARLWQTWYSYTESGPNRPPAFLMPSIKAMFTAGKTTAFARALGCTTSLCDQAQPKNILTGLNDGNTLLPFAASSSTFLEHSVSTHLQSATSNLQRSLHQTCDLSSTLSALSMLYLASSPLATDILDTRLSSHLDRCLSSWNDRFMISDLISETFPTELESARIAVHCEHTATSDLLLARRSVEVLENIAFDYILPWPIANILLPETLASYRRVSLLLMQLRRAKHVLERRAYMRIRILCAFPNAVARRVAKQAQCLQTLLLIFTTTLYSHLTSLVIHSLAANLHQAIKSEQTVDDLIVIHQQYLKEMEFGCLTAKNLRILKGTLISMLDVCLEFGFGLTDLPMTMLKSFEGEGGESGVNEAEKQVKGFEEKMKSMKSQVWETA